MKLIKPSANLYVCNTNMVEHTTVYLKFDHYGGWLNSAKYVHNKYSVVVENIIPETEEKLAYTERLVTTTYHVLYENGWLDDLEFVCEPTEHHEKRISVCFVCDRDMMYKLAQHHNFTFTEIVPKQRPSPLSLGSYVDTINDELTFIEPSWIKEYDPEFDFEKNPQTDNLLIRTFINSLKRIEEDYFCLATYLQHEGAETIRPNCLKTEVILTGFLSDWLGEIKLFNGNQYMRRHKWSPQMQCDIKNFISIHEQKNLLSSKPGLKIIISGFFPNILYPNGVVPYKNTQFQDLIKSLYMKFEEKGYINKYNT